MPFTRRDALAFQAAYYVATGLWPLLNRHSFEALTGKKHDWWLVQMVALLALTNGAALAAGLTRERIGRETLTLSIGSALSFAAIDAAYALRGRISKIYLADAALEIALATSILRTREAI